LGIRDSGFGTRDSLDHDRHAEGRPPMHSDRAQAVAPTIRGARRSLARERIDELENNVRGVY